MAPVKKKKENARNLRYPESAMKSAIIAVREGRFKLREAGRQYGVPHNTLSNKLKGVVPEGRKMGRETYLTNNEEKLLVSYIEANAKKGIPLKRQSLVDTVKKIIDEDGRKTPFKCNRPGRKWIDLFMKRHPQLSEKKAESISTARANVTEADLRQWSESLKQYLTEEQALEILDDPRRIYNADESGFQTCPQSGRVLGPRGMKNFFEVKSGKEKEQLTVMACINAAGEIVYPMIVYPLVRISKDIACNVPTGWAIGRSPKGWMTGPLYYEYIANVFDPWLKTQNVKKPVLLLIDGHRSHMTMQVSEYCAENQIFVHALYPNSTHITQPADVSLFKCLKSGWKNTVFEYKQSTCNKYITRAGFAPLLSKVFQDKVTPQIVANGFKRCGIYPFDPSAVDYSKCMDNKVRKVLPSAAEVEVETILLMESFMRRGRAEQFRKAENEDWQGDESATELFYVWKKFRRQCLQENVAEDGVTEDNTGTAKPGTENPSPKVNEQEGKTSPCQDYNMPPSPSIMKTQPRTDSTMCSSVASPDKNHPDAESRTTPELNEQEAGSLNNQEYFQPSPSINKTPPPSSETSSTKHINSKLIEIMVQKQKLVSPAFGNHILFPSDSPIKKYTKERIPLAVTSPAFREYFKSKEQEKKRKAKEVEIRKRKREEIKANKSQRAQKAKNSIQPSKKKITSKKSRRQVIWSDSETESNEDKKSEQDEREVNEESSNSDSENITLNRISAKTKKLSKGDYVIITYEGEYFPGVVESVDQYSFEISTMIFSTGKTFRWPEKPDKLWYSEKDIVERIDTPVLTNKRGFYMVKEMSKFLPFTV